MNSIDEPALRAALREAAGSITVSDDAVDAILLAADVESNDGRKRFPTAFSTMAANNQRALRVAAVVMAVAVIAVPLIQRSSTTPGSVAMRSANTHGGIMDSSQKLGNLTWSSSYYLGPHAVVPNSSAAGTSANFVSNNSKVKTSSARIESSGSMSLTVERGRFQQALARLSEIAAQLGGFVSSTQVQVGSRAAHTYSFGTVILQVPQSNFNQLVSRVQQKGHATSINTNSSDVTVQYNDLQAQIRALEAGRQQYITIMARATSISDILAVQSRLTAIQGQIDQARSEFQTLQSAVTYGSLSIDVSERGAFKAPPLVKTSGLAKAWHDSVGGFVAGFEWVVRAVGPTIFAILVLGALLLAARSLWRVARRRAI